MQEQRVGPFRPAAAGGFGNDRQFCDPLGLLAQPVAALLGDHRFGLGPLFHEPALHRCGQILQTATPHGDCRDYRHAQFFLDRLAERDHFQRKAQMIVEIGGIEHQNDGVGAAFALLQSHDDAARHFLVGAGRIEAVAARQVDQFRWPTIGKGEMSGFALNRHARIIGNLLTRAGKGIEQGAFAGIGVARKDNERCDFGHQSGGDRNRNRAYRDRPGVGFADRDHHPSDPESDRVVHPEHALVELFHLHAGLDAERPQTPALIVGNGGPVDRDDFGALPEGQQVQGCG